MVLNIPEVNISEFSYSINILDFCLYSVSILASY